MATPPKKVISRFATEVPRFQRILQAAKDRDVNEADTVTIISDILADVFGFDKYSEVTGEYAIRNTYCDLAVKLDGEVKFLAEVKAIGLGLKENHLKQAVDYGANHGVQWVVLTNGVEWSIHRVLFERPVRAEEVCAFNFLDINARRTVDQEMLFLLCKEGLNKAAIEDFHKHKKCVNRFVIGAILVSETAVSMVRRELRKINPGLKVDASEIEAILTSEVLKRDVVDSEPAKKAAAKVKRSNMKTKKKEAHHDASEAAVSDVGANALPMLVESSE